jgi:NADH-quinone oxidoreductase subunit J
MTVNLVLLSGLLIVACVAVMKRDIVKAAIALALTSITLSAFMFRLASPLAAVFELSVCGGLVTVIFMCTISQTKPLVLHQEDDEELNTHGWRFAALPILLLLAAGVLARVPIPVEGLALPPATPGADVRNVLWTERQLDLLGQTLIIFVGFFGILVLFKRGVPGVERTDAERMKRAPSEGQDLNSASANEETASESATRG